MINNKLWVAVTITVLVHILALYCLVFINVYKPKKVEEITAPNTVAVSFLNVQNTGQHDKKPQVLKEQSVQAQAIKEQATKKQPKKNNIVKKTVIESTKKPITTTKKNNEPQKQQAQNIVKPITTQDTTKKIIVTKNKNVTKLVQQQEPTQIRDVQEKKLPKETRKNNTEIHQKNGAHTANNNTKKSSQPTTTNTNVNKSTVENNQTKNDKTKNDKMKNDKTKTTNNNNTNQPTGKTNKNDNSKQNAHMPKGNNSATDAPINSIGNNQNAEKQWRALVQAQLQANLKYPDRAKEKGWKGKTIVTITIEANGKLKQVLVKRSSGKKVLDREAKATAKRSSPLPQPPEHLIKNKKVTFDIPVRFK